MCFADDKGDFLVGIFLIIIFNFKKIWASSIPGLLLLNVPNISVVTAVFKVSEDNFSP